MNHKRELLHLINANRSLPFMTTVAPVHIGYEITPVHSDVPVVCVKYMWPAQVIETLIGCGEYTTKPVLSMANVADHYCRLLTFKERLVVAIDRLIAALDIPDRFKLPLILVSWEIGYLMMRLDIGDDSDVIEACKKFYDEYILQLNVIDDSTELAKFISKVLIEYAGNVRQVYVTANFTLSQSSISKTIYAVEENIRHFGGRLREHYGEDFQYIVDKHMKAC